MLVSDRITIADGQLDLFGVSIWRIVQDPNRRILRVATPDPASNALWTLAAIVGAVFLVASVSTIGLTLRL